MKIKEKLRKYCKHKGLSHASFCEKIEVSNKFLATNGRVYSDVLPKIRKVFTDLNMDWVLYDEGSMLLSETKEVSYTIASEPPPIYNLNEKYTKLLEDKVETLEKTIEDLKESKGCLKKDDNHVPVE